MPPVRSGGVAAKIITLHGEAQLLRTSSGIAGSRDVAGFDVAAFDLDDDAFCFARIVVNENQERCRRSV